MAVRSSRDARRVLVSVDYPMQVKSANHKRGLSRLSWKPSSSCGLGIDIGQRATKIVSVQRQRDAIQAICAVCIPTRPETNQVGSTQCNWSTREIKELSRVIQRVLNGRSTSRRTRVAVTLSMSACDYRTVYVPQDTQVSLRAVQETIAAAKNDHRARCIALLPNAVVGESQEQQDKLRCFSLPEELSWSVAQSLDEAGLTPSVLNGAPWCMAGAMRLAAAAVQPDRINVALDWSFGSPTLVAMQAGEISYVRSMLHGSVQDLVATAGRDYQMDTAEGVHWIGQCLEHTALNVADAAQIETYDAVSRICSQLAEELRTALEYIAWRHQGCKVGTLWLMGGAARINGLSDLLQSKLTCPVAQWQVNCGETCLTAEYALAAALAWGEA